MKFRKIWDFSSASPFFEQIVCTEFHKFREISYQAVIVRQFSFIFTCLFGASGFDIRSQMRKGIDDENLVGLISKIWTNRKDRYSEERSSKSGSHEKVEMHHIGG